MARKPAPPPPVAPRLWYAALLLAFAGLVLAVLLVRVHHDAHAGLTSFCTVSEEVNCDKVALSEYSVLLGVPVAAWGVLGYALAAVLALSGLMARRLHPRWPAGLLLAFGALSTAGSLALALVSKLIIGAWCLLCMGSWLASLGLLVVGALACRPTGPWVALADDLDALQRVPRRSGALLAGGLLLVLALIRFYPQPPPHLPRPPVDQVRATPLPPATGPAILFSDYECPFCAVAHGELKATLLRRPDIQVVRRHFPLDQACNPVMKRPMHEHACELARAAVCAEAQGRLEEMDDALFANQKARAPVEELAARLGLDAGKFRACLDSPATTARIAADVQAALLAGIKATPTYVVDGTLYQGTLPLERFPLPVSPPTGASTPPAAR
jgi:uncharacterized membrane protein/predicted DsbA family dithiol-disulfide isomerase